MQSALATEADRRLHVAIVMDGNGRWGTRRGLDRSAGHRAGAEAVERVVEAAPDLGIDVLTLFAFSADNWQRPRAEVDALMRLLRAYVRSETSRCVENGVRLSVIGRRDRLAAPIVRAIERAERVTRAGTCLHLRIAIDYSARETIARAARRWAEGGRRSLDDLARLIAAPDGVAAVPDVDLLVRTGGEQRLSDFLLWECAYAELYFVDRLWPDFGPDDLAAALAEYARRERRFGRVPAAPPARGTAPTPKTSEEWIEYFVGNRARLRAVPWERGAELDAKELVAVAESVRIFQLGEKGEGRHLVRYARVGAERCGDPRYVDAARLLVAEEKRHSQDLGRFMALNGIPELGRTWTDDVFKRLRNVLATLEVSVGVLVTAEIIAKAYYPLLHDATRSSVLRTICTQIQDDERRHVEFQTQQLARLRVERGALGRFLTRALHRLFFAATMLVVGIGHRRVFRASGAGVTGFLRLAWREFARDLVAMEAPAPVRTPVAGAAPLPTPATPLGGRS